MVGFKMETQSPKAYQLQHIESLIIKIDIFNESKSVIVIELLVIYYL